MPGERDYFWKGQKKKTKQNTKTHMWKITHLVQVQVYPGFHSIWDPALAGAQSHAQLCVRGQRCHHGGRITQLIGAEPQLISVYTPGRLAASPESQISALMMTEGRSERPSLRLRRVGTSGRRARPGLARWPGRERRGAADFTEKQGKKKKLPLFTAGELFKVTMETLTAFT